MTIFCLQLLTAGVLYILGDWMNVDLAFVSNVDSQTLFIVSTLMILTTLASIPAGLRLFKFSKVASEIKMEGKPALLKWSIIRMVLIGDLLVINTMLYYFFGFEPAFGYLAIVCLLTMPFILPTMSRCKSELEA
jgi:hypothetical protein